MAEDEESIRELISEFLGGAGFTILAVANGTEALALAKSYSGDLRKLITDVVIPGMGGRELADRLRRSRPGVPMLFMPGYADDARLRRGVSETQDHYLENPSR